MQVLQPLLLFSGKHVSLRMETLIIISWVIKKLLGICLRYGFCLATDLLLCDFEILFLSAGISFSVIFPGYIMCIIFRIR